MIMMVECSHCEDGKVWTSKHGGNDPGVWAVECQHCNGTGAVECDLNDEAGDEDGEW